MHNHKSKIIIICSCNNDNSKDILLFPFPSRVMITTVHTETKTLDVKFFNNFEDNDMAEGIVIPQYSIIIFEIC